MSHLHFMGIGGVSMQGLARWWHADGHRSAAATPRRPRHAGAARRSGIRVWHGHDPKPTSTRRRHPRDHHGGAARSPRGAARARAGHARGAAHRPAGRAVRAPPAIGITGTHGKSTTTGLTATLALAADVDPSIQIGASLAGLPSTTSGYGSGRLLVAEVDESDPGFAHLRAGDRGGHQPRGRPRRRRVRRAPQLPRQHARPRARHRALRRRRRARPVLPRLAGPGSAARRHPGAAATAPIRTPTTASATSSWRATAAASTLRLPSGRVARADAHHPGSAQRPQRRRRPRRDRPRRARRGRRSRRRCRDFRGVGRRWQRWGEVDGALIVDDYAHHPTEVAATLASARRSGRRVRAVLQPHRWVRTARHWPALATPRGSPTRCWCSTSTPRASARSTASPRTLIVAAPRELGTRRRTTHGQRRRVPARVPWRRATWSSRSAPATSGASPRRSSGDRRGRADGPRGDATRGEATAPSRPRRRARGGGAHGRPGGRAVSAASQLRPRTCGSGTSPRQGRRRGRAVDGGRRARPARGHRRAVLRAGRRLQPPRERRSARRAGGAPGKRPTRRLGLRRQRDVWLGAATPLPGLVRRAQRLGLSGLEGLLGVPAQLGGAVVMNAGTRFGCLADTLQEVEVMLDGASERLPAAALGLRYRHSELPAGAVVTRARLRLSPSTPERVAQAMRQVDAARKGQPKVKSAGCAFKNPPGDSAGRLIDAAGCKGLRVGDAMVSVEHANFVVNLGRARAPTCCVCSRGARARRRAAGARVAPLGPPRRRPAAPGLARYAAPGRAAGAEAAGRAAHRHRHRRAARALVLVTRYWPTIERIEVIGNAHHSRERMMRLANVAPGDPFLWVTRFGLRGLVNDPWVLHTRVTATGRTPSRSASSSASRCSATASRSLGRSTAPCCPTCRARSCARAATPGGLGHAAARGGARPPGDAEPTRRRGDNVHAGRVRSWCSPTSSSSHRA
jgi:hypothetical protein